MESCWAAGLLYLCLSSDTEVFRNLPLKVPTAVVFFIYSYSVYFKLGLQADLAHRKQEQGKKDEKYKAELLRTAKKQKQPMRQKPKFLQRMSHDIRTPINGICGMINGRLLCRQYGETDGMPGQRSKRHLICYAGTDKRVPGHEQAGVR